MSRTITPATSVDGLKKEAKTWLKDLRSGTPEARARFLRAYPAGPERPVLRDVQHALAREYGFDNWLALSKACPLGDQTVAPGALRGAREYEAAAIDLVAAFDAHDGGALQRLNSYYGRDFTHDDLWAEVWRRVYAFRQRAFSGSPQQLKLEEALLMIAQDAGFGSWDALMSGVAGGAGAVAAHDIDEREQAIGPRRLLSASEWERLIAVMKERRLTSFHANGQATNDVLARVASLDHVTSLNLGGSRQLTDEGLAHLARMPQLEHLDLSEYPGGRLTDRGLAVLAHLPNLRSFTMTWQRGITDAGLAGLRGSERLECVDVMGTLTGNGLLEALAGKPRLRQLRTGRLVTDAGLPLLHDIPLTKAPPATPIGGAPPASGMQLLLDGPFTDHGLRSLAGLDGLVDLDLFWHVTVITSEAFATIATLPHLLALGADGRLSDDAALRYFGMMPSLRRLRIQEAVATDAGFEALARSTSLQHLWGRVCPNFGSRGFAALSRMPSLTNLGIGCGSVDDRALSALPRFPALRELTPIGFQDDGFRHIGACERLERLSCMYCRDTTDAATAHITNLRLKYYYAGLTQITDRTLELLGTMPAFEHIEFYECKGVTDAGLRSIATLPNLREVDLHGLPGVTLAGTNVFPPRVHVRYST